MIIVAIGKMHHAWNYIAKLGHKQVPFWVRASGKAVWFVCAVISLEIFDSKI